MKRPVVLTLVLLLLVSALPVFAQGGPASPVEPATRLCWGYVRAEYAPVFDYPARNAIGWLSVPVRIYITATMVVPNTALDIDRGVIPGIWVEIESMDRRTGWMFAVGPSGFHYVYISPETCPGLLTLPEYPFVRPAQETLAPRA